MAVADQLSADLDRTAKAQSQRITRENIHGPKQRICSFTTMKTHLERSSGNVERDGSAGKTTLFGPTCLV